MHAIRAASVALAGLAVLGLGAPAAQAENDREKGRPFHFDLTPTTIAPGGKVTFDVEGCREPVEITSGIFDPVVIPKEQNTGTATVDWDAKPGAVYTVSFDCPGQRGGDKDLTVTGGGGRPDGQGHHRPDTGPRKGVHAGIGGSLGDLDLHELGLGAALVAGAIGSAYYWTRRRTGETGS